MSVDAMIEAWVQGCPAAPQGGVEAAPGQPAQLSTVLRNTSAEPIDVTVEVVGLDPSWLSAARRVESLLPGETASSTVIVTPPPGTSAGRYPVVVAVQPLAGSMPVGDPIHLDAVVAVGDIAGIRLALDPAEASGVRSRRLNVELENRGSTPVTVGLKASASAGLRVALGESTTTVPGGQTAKVRGRLTLRPKLFGQARHIPFIVTAQGRTTPLRADGVFIARPLFGPTAVRVLATALVLALWAAAALVGVDKISQRAHKKDNLTAAAASPSPSASSLNDGTGGAGRPGGSGGSGGSGGAEPAANGLALARVNGTVTGPSPAGVTVTLSPTSLVDEAAEGATFVGVAQQRNTVGKISAMNVSFVRAGTVGSTTVTTTTASDGSFAFGGVRTPGYYLVTFEKAGYQTKRYVVSPKVGDTTPLSVPMSAGDGTLSGAVTGPTGPLGGVGITITDGTVTIATSTPTSGDVGDWSVSGISTPGTYLVTAAANGFGAESTLVKLPAGGTLGGIDLTLHPGVEALTGKVSGPDLGGDVTGLGGITVTATNGKVTRTATTVTTGPVGQYTLPDLPVPSAYTVTFSANGYAVRTAQVDLAGDTPSHTLDALMSLSTATVTGTITDAGGAGLIGAGVVLSGENGTYKTTTVSDPAGAFRITGVVPGSYVLTAQKFGYETQYTQVVVAMGTPLDVPALPLPAHPGEVLASTSRVQGTVIDASTNDAISCGLATCSYTVSTSEERSDGTYTFTTTVTVTPGDQNPQYMLPKLTDTDGLLPGLHTLTVSSAGYETSTVNVQVPLGGVATAPVVALHPSATLTGTITPVVGAVPAGTCVVMVPVTVTSTTAPPCKPDTTAIGGCTSDTGNFCGIVDSKNQYTVRPNHGSYNVWVVPGDADYLVTGPVFVSLDVSEVKTYNAVLNRLGRLQVFVQQPDPAGNLVASGAGVTVTATPFGGGAVTTGTTDLTGGVLLTGLQPGTYTLQATDGGALSGVVTVGVQLNSTGSSPTNVVMTAAITGVRGRLVYKVDGNPQPVGSATVTLTGVWFYWGTTPYKISLPVTTDANGCFAFSENGALPADVGTGVCETGSVPTVQLPIVTPYVDVSIAPVTGFPTISPSPQNGLSVSSASLFTVSVNPPPRRVSGTITVAGGGAVDLSTAKISVISQAAGSGTLTLTSDSSGVINWIDSNEGSAANVAWPGTYTLQASLPGYDSAPTTITIPAATDGSTYAFSLTLKAFGSLTVGAVDQGGKVIVNTALTSSDPPTLVFTVNGQTKSPGPGGSTVTFSNLSSNQTYAVVVHAAGYLFATSDPLSVTAGDNSPATQNVTLTRDGAISGTVYAAVYSSDGATQLSKSTVAGVTVTATDGTNTFFGVSATDGTYRITGTPTVQGLDINTTWTVTTGATAAYGSTSGTVTIATTSSDTSYDVVMKSNSASLAITVQSDGKPAQSITDATVKLYSSSTGTLTATSTSGSNVYTFPNLPPLSYTLTVTASNYGQVTKTETVLPGQAATDTITMATLLNTFAGTVIGYRAGVEFEKVQGATVTVFDSSTKNQVGTATTDVNGDFTVDNLKDDTYFYQVSATNYTTFVSKSFKLTGGSVTATEVDLNMVSHSVTLTVKSSLTGISMNGAIVTLTPQQTTGTTQTATVSSGTAVFNQVYPATYDISISGPTGHYADTPAPSTLTVDTTDLTPTVTVNELELKISVTANPAQPTLSTTVSVTATGDTTALVTQTVTADGTMHNVYVDAAQTYTVKASATGYQDATFTSTANDTSDAVALVLNQIPGSMKVTVKDSTGKTVSGVTLTLSVGPTAGTATTDTNGVATFDSLLPGDYTVTASNTGSPSITGSVSGQTVSSGNQTNTNLTINDGSMTVTVKDSANNPVAGATVTLSGGNTSGSMTTDATGQAHFANVAPGTYTVTMSKSGTVTLAGTATNQVVNSGADTAVAVTVDNGSLQVTVKNGSGTVSGATVSLSNGPSSPGSLTTDTTGVATFSNLIPGTYDVTVTSTGGNGSAPGEVVNSGTTPTTVTVTVP